MNIFIINKVKQGDKSKVSNLNKEQAFFGSCELIIAIKIFSK